MVETKTESTPKVKRRASQSFGEDGTRGGQGSKIQKTGKVHPVESHEEGRALLGLTGTNVIIDTILVPLVPVPYNPRGHRLEEYGAYYPKSIQSATTCLSQFPGFAFRQYDSTDLQEIVFFLIGLTKRGLGMRRFHKLFCRFISLIFREMLLQKAVYTRVTDYTTKRACFYHIHQIHYSILIQRQNGPRNPVQPVKPNAPAER